MARITVDDVVYSERAEDKVWEHGIVPTQFIEAISAQTFKIERNRADRAAPYIYMGAMRKDGASPRPLFPPTTRAFGRLLPRGTASHLKSPNSTRSVQSKRKLMTDKPIPTNREREEQDVEAWIARSSPDDWEAVEVVVSPNLAITLQMTFDREQLQILTEAAGAANMPVICWIKQLALDQAQRYAKETVSVSH